MRAYWFDNLPGDQRAPHDSGREVDATYLSSLGILHYNTHSRADVDAVAAERGYKNRDEITISPTSFGSPTAYQDKISMFFNEHLHEDEEIRYILDGGGYFDVRSDGDNEWIRIQLEKGDLMIFPAGIYHRFTTDEADYTKAMRLFKDEPKWTPLNRGPETDANEFRKGYVEMRKSLRAGTAH